jgi:hypothetical protein
VGEETLPPLQNLKPEIVIAASRSNVELAHYQTKSVTAKAGKGGILTSLANFPYFLVILVPLCLGA